MGLNWENVDGPMVSVTWADCMGPIRDVSGLSLHEHKQGKLCERHIGSVTWAPHMKPMWAG